MGMSRIVWIDYAKAIGILFVVMGHSYYSHPSVVYIIFLFHMPLFFFISGYLYNVNKNCRELIHNNIKTLLVPFLLFNLIGLVNNCLLGGARLLLGLDTEWNHRLLIPLCNTLIGKAEGMFIGPTWFLLSLFWCKNIVYAFVKGGYWRRIIIIITVLVLLLFRFYNNVYYPYALDTACAGVIWFTLGFMVRQYNLLFDLRRQYILIIFICSVILEFLLYRLGARVNYITMNMGGVLGICSTIVGLIMIISVSKLLERFPNKYIVNVSRASILIMCMHMIIANYLNIVLHYEGGLLYTFVGDLIVVILLTWVYPFVSRYIPILVGNRK